VTRVMRESGTHVLDAFRVFLFVHVSIDCVAYEHIDYGLRARPQGQLSGLINT